MTAMKASGVSRGATQDTETRVIEIWRRVFDGRDVSPDDVFLDLAFEAIGGTSLKATMMLTLLHAEFGIDLPLSAIYELPSARALAQFIDTRLEVVGVSPGRNVVALSSRCSGAPISQMFLLHDSSERLDAVMDLAVRLSDQVGTVWGVHARPTEPDGLANMSLGEMATGYIEDMRRVHDGSPWILGGWSFGGILAFELARQLARAGEPVAALLLLDAEAPQPRDWQELLRSFSSVMRENFVQAAATTPLDAPIAAQCRRLVQRIGRYERGKAWLLDNAPREIMAALPRWSDHDFDSQMSSFVRIVDHIGVLAGYSPEVGMPGAHITVIAHASSSAEIVTERAWSPYLPGRYRTLELDGDHWSILKPPGVDTIVELCSELWDEIGSTSRDGGGRGASTPTAGSEDT